MPPLVYFNGNYLPKDQVRISPDDRGFLFADGIYEVARSYGGKFFELGAHLARMRNGLAALAIEGVRAEDLGAVFTSLLERNDLTKVPALVYAQVTRGASPRTHFFPDPPVPPTVYAEAKRFAPKGDPAKGVAVITVPDTRWARCDIKTVGLIPNCLANQRAHAAGALEALFMRDGVVLEATASSFFAVVDGEVRTAPASNYILPSITRGVVLRICGREKIAYRETPVYLDDLPRASELFLAGTTLEVMPIVTVDSRPVGDGKPGPVARRLGELFRAETSR
jgi:D-alanine transaminase